LTRGRLGLGARDDKPTGLRVFISGASGALAVYRSEAVDACRRLGLIPVHMEEFDPQRPTPEQVCRREVHSCDVFVLLLAHRYGARPPGSRFSYTELEYGWAADRPEVPLLAFVVDPEFPWPPLDIDSGADADAQAKFVTRVKSSHVIKKLAEISVFREDLLVALSHADAARSATVQRKLRPKKTGMPPPAKPEAPLFHAVPPFVGSAPFTGRREDLVILDEWGRSGDPVMTVQAIGGTGKSALTWQWARDRAPRTIDGLAGRMWWSFYDGTASVNLFLQELLSYISGRPSREIRRLSRADLATEVLNELRSRPYLVILDGFERLLLAYHRVDPTKVRDEEVEEDQRSLIEASTNDAVRMLAAAEPSKILISTRLMPRVLEGRFGEHLPGVRHLTLSGLTEADTRSLLKRLGVRGSDSAIAGFFGPLENHPLLVGLVAGLVRDYRAAPGDFDRWFFDPTAGGALRIPDLVLTQRRNHILKAALNGLEPGTRRLLGHISVLPGSVTWETLVAINPFWSDRPGFADPGLRPKSAGQGAMTDRPGLFRSVAQPNPGTQVLRVTAQLDAALKDLENRGLVSWDRSSNSYDLHPIVRVYTYDQLENSPATNVGTASTNRNDTKAGQYRVDPVGRLRWTAFDLSSYFPEGWQEEIMAVAGESEFRAFPRTPVLSREATGIAHIERGRVNADIVKQRLPWLYQLYRSAFSELASQACGEPAEAALDERYGLVLNVQRGTRMRFECHIDSNPLTGLIFFTDHPAGGGELVFGHDPAASSVEAVERDCSVIRPQAGQLIFFDGRKFPHYARPLLSESDIKIVATMNFYTQSWPELSRPRELNRHLFGDE
jgi:hypothetical protein